MGKVPNFDQIIEEVRTAKYADDRKVLPIKGVRGLTKSDADTVLLYVNEYKNNGAASSALMPPRGKVKEVLDRYGIVFLKHDLLHQ